MHAALPLDDVKLPGAQSVCVVAPVEHDEPAGQSVHSPADVRLVELEYEPASHGSAALAPAGQYEPLSHARQLSVFALGWYVPPAHAVHSAARVEPLYVPAAQGRAAVAPVEHEAPTGQSVHSVAAPRLVELE